MLSVQWLGILIEMLVRVTPMLIRVPLVDEDVAERAFPSVGGGAAGRR